MRFNANRDGKADDAESIGAAEQVQLEGNHLAIPPKGAYIGAYIAGVEDSADNTENGVTLERIENFEDLVGKHQAIVAFSSYWGENSFPTASAKMAVGHQSIPMIFWSPWGPPYRAGPRAGSLRIGQDPSRRLGSIHRQMGRRRAGYQRASHGFLCE